MIIFGIMNSFNERLGFIIKDKITPLLKEQGFKKNQWVYTRDLGQIQWLIDIQKSRWNDEEETQFTLNCGIFIPGVLSIYINISEPKNPKIENCVCSARVGMLASKKKDIWWKLTSDDLDEYDSKVGNDIQEKIKDYIFPFLENFHVPEDVASFLSSDFNDEYQNIFPMAKAQRYAYAGIIYFNMGENDKASESLDIAYQASINSPIEEIISNLKNKFVN